MSINKVLLGHRRAHLLVCWGCFVLQQQSWTFETETMLPTKPKIYLSLALYGKSLLTPTLEIRSFLFILTWNRRCVLFHRLYCVLKCCCFILCAHASVCVCVWVKVNKYIHTHSFYSAFSLLLWQSGSLSSIHFRINSICFPCTQKMEFFKKGTKA